MVELRRTRVGAFVENNSLATLQNLKDAFTIYQEENDDFYLKKIISPMEKMVYHLPKVYVRDSAVDALCHGAALASAGICYIDARIKPGSQVALMTLKKELMSSLKIPLILTSSRIKKLGPFSRGTGSSYSNSSGSFSTR